MSTKLRRWVRKIKNEATWSGRIIFVLVTSNDLKSWHIFNITSCDHAMREKSLDNLYESIPLMQKDTYRKLIFYRAVEFHDYWITSKRFKLVFRSAISSFGKSLKNNFLQKVSSKQTQEGLIKKFTWLIKHKKTTFWNFTHLLKLPISKFWGRTGWHP